MKKNYRILFCVLCVWVLIAFPTAAKTEVPTGQGNETLKSLIDELQTKVNDADKKMIAHPKFIKELRRLIRKYKHKLRALYLYEDFMDGDYTQNPKWIVESGYFHITPDKKLISRMESTRPARKKSSRQKQDQLSTILNEILKTRNEDDGDGDRRRQNRRVSKEARIRTMARISPTFEVDIQFESESNWGRMEIVLFGGGTVTPRYKLIYKASPSSNRPIEIIRVRNNREYIIESAMKYPNLDDGRPHRMQWIRDKNGNMTVLVDGKEVLSTVELFYKKEFSGLGFINHGGKYAWKSIKVMQAPRSPRQ